MNNLAYDNPLTGRYASKEMSYNWSPQKKHSTWRRLWLALATAEQKLGLDITDLQLEQMSEHLDDIDFKAVAAKEQELRHDVMSHIHVFGTQCPAAMPIIHLGATSCFVTDNTELIQLRDGMLLIRKKLLQAIKVLADVAEQYKDLPTLGFTHYQPAQLTTVGKRFSLYLQDLLFDFERLDSEIERLAFRSVKGTTGTQASFMALFDGDHTKVKQLETMVAEDMKFEKIIDVSGQTYTRKVDFYILSVMSGIAQSANKMASDIRLLANLREAEEPFGKKQIGSSAMAYKRNPMRSERICSLARYVMSLPANAANTHANQWFERTLDDSANRRIVLPEAFLATDVILSLIINVMDGIQIWPNVVGRRVAAELPFMATENIMMAAVQLGGNRQDLHEAIREHSMDAAKKIKEAGGDNDLLDRLKADPAFAVVADQIDDLVNPIAFIGRAPEQVTEFLTSRIQPLLDEWKNELADNATEEIAV